MSDQKAPATDDAKRNKRRKIRRRIRRLVVTLVLLALLGAGGFIGYRMMSGPAHGTVSTILPESNVPAEQGIELEQFDGKNISFAHPSNYVQRTVKDPPASDLETVQFVASGLVNKLLSISVTRLPSGNLEDDPSYYMRSIKPETYKITKLQLQGETAMLAVNSKDYQQAVFWPHGGKLLTFAINSITMDTSTTNDEYQQMVQSIRWR